uniref:CCAAT/enhancer-binding protein zeta-like n=1 Tax=Dermatophagoides pteronyssinus TaxID=6956 RepID=A0A6P6XP13_DERPT|nr:CCAAT/enhancer-binding protein zeta-like [Dermatophagoides pteronyssinus]
MNPKKISHQYQSKWKKSNHQTNNDDGNNRKQTLLIPAGTKWYRQKVIDNIPTNSDQSLRLSHDHVTELRAEAIKLLKSDYYVYDQQKQYGSKAQDFEWIKTVLSNGTVQDKLAANTILIQDSSVHNLRSLEQLIRFVNGKGKRECIMAIDTIRDLFIGDLLIPREKLQSFEEQINSVDHDFLLNTDSFNIYRRKFLLITHVEDQIRSLYRRFIEQLVQCSHDTLDTLKMKSIRTLYDLFINNPEQEKLLLESLINKLGDPAPRVASTTARLLAQILQHHSQMKMIIVKEVERLLFRPNITARTEYYCLCFLSEIIYQANVDRELANHVIQIYFTIFTKCTKLGEVNSKIMSVLLTGVSRAFPYSKLESDLIEKHLNTFYKLIHYVNRNTAIQTLSLMFQMILFSENGSLTDRFYSSLYRFLLDTTLDQCNKLNLLLNILYRSMKHDPIIRRVRAFIKRLLQLCLHSSTSFVIAILILIGALMKTKDGFKIDIIPIQMDTKIDENFNDDDDDDKDRKKSNGQIKSWVYVDLKKNNENQNDNEDDGKYRFDCRNPLYANADQEPCWELFALRNHFHPTVQMFVQKIINNESFEYDGDPLEDFSLKHFLDRFSFKNPKRIENNDQDGQTKNLGKIFSRIPKTTTSTSTMNINSKDYINQNEEQIPIDERFIYKFLQQRKSNKMEKSKNGDDNDDDESDIESVTSLEFNDLLDNYEQYVGDDSIDFAKDLQTSTKKKSTKKQTKSNDGDDDEADFDEEFDDEDFDMEDFEDDDDDDGSIHSNSNDDEEFPTNDEDEDEQNFEPEIIRKAMGKNRARNAAPFKGKHGFSSITNDIFASAEQFDHLLDQNDADSDYEMNMADDDNNDVPKHSKSKKPAMKRKRKPSNLGRSRKQKSIKK